QRVRNPAFVGKRGGGLFDLDIGRLGLRLQLRVQGLGRRRTEGLFASIFEYPGQFVALGRAKERGRRRGNRRRRRRKDDRCPGLRGGRELHERARGRHGEKGGADQGGDGPFGGRSFGDAGTDGDGGVHRRRRFPELLGGF